MCAELCCAFQWARRLTLLALGAALLVPTHARAQQTPVARAVAVTEASDMQAEHELTLKVSEQQVIGATGVRSYSEGTRGVVDVRLTRAGDQFVRVGQKPGKTSLLLIMDSGEQKHVSIAVIDPEGTVRRAHAPTVDRQDNIRLDFYFVQLNRSNRLNVGLAYPASISMGTFSAGFDFLTQRFESATAVVQDQALLRLDMAQAGGWAKLQRKAAVITENGQQTKFSGGGEVNIPVVGSRSTGIHAIEFGSTVEVLPLYDEQTGRIQISLHAQVSDLTDDRGSGVPGRVTSDLNTVVNLELGQAVILAGLSSESRVETRSGVPGLSQVPIIGWLFGGQHRDYQTVDNVIFIIPTVVNATSHEAREQIKAALDIYKNYQGQKSAQSALHKQWEKK
jgi:pilus assembly protein CpaC